MQTAFARSTETAGDHQTLEQLNLEYVRAVAASDVQWFDRHLAPDFMNSNPDGSLVDRAGFLAQVARGPGVSGIKAHDVIIRVLGDLAIIHARTSFETLSGKVGSGRYTDIWSRRQERWLCVAAHVARC
jgi:ketosteroid isomerase-like protein